MPEQQLAIRCGGGSGHGAQLDPVGIKLLA
jgi:hypothetical protein